MSAVLRPLPSQWRWQAQAPVVAESNRKEAEVTVLLCDACDHEPRVGKIDVPEIGNFGIGDSCLALRNAAMRGYGTLRDCARVMKMRRDDPAVDAWVAQLIVTLRATARCVRCKHSGERHGPHVGCHECLCPETNPLKLSGEAQVA